MSRQSNTSQISIRLPKEVYDDLLSLKSASLTTPVQIITELVREARQYHDWLEELTQLRARIREDGGLQIGTNENDVIETLRRTRETVFNEEYAHLYR